jgi:hypothetical protein
MLREVNIVPAAAAEHKMLCEQRENWLNAWWCDSKDSTSPFAAS